MPNQLDLSAALRAIGVKGAQGFLDLLRALQPTVQLADLSEMGPAILAPTSLMGTRRFGIALARPVIQMTTLAKGGSFVRFQVGADTDNAEISFNVVDLAVDPIPFLNPTALRNIRVAHQPSVVTGFSGTSLPSSPLLGEEAPNLAGLNRQVVLGGGWIYVPSGRTLALQSNTIGATSALLMVSQWRDVPVPPGADALTATLP